MKLSLVNPIALILICILIFLVVQLLIVKKFKDNTFALSIQYIFFISTLLYVISEKKLIIDIIVMIFAPMIMIFLSVITNIYIKKNKNNIDIMKSIVMISNIKLLKYYIYIILSPILEELFFRLYLTGIILSKESIIVKIILPTIIFAISHLKLKVIIESFLGGLILSCIYIYTYNIFLVIGIHIAYNAMCMSIKNSGDDLKV
ncbi:CPBP family intramembrane glutamic endopeptidase [Streptococcus constellatus subsp. viborgensis]|nr:CPBP family intramembrane glutamic endopeptidase [Streptococcus constellatus]QQC23079.1 CPBP family intramembrane metalloprotease [Streptococcus constellatus]HEX1861181.1 CPBP family intramembrane metalloprotease [Streptococcus pneumoniae]